VTAAETVVLSVFDLRIQPKLRFSSLTLNMDVKPRFFPGKEVEPKPILLEDRRTHAERLPRGSVRSVQVGPTPAISCGLGWRDACASTRR